MIFKFHYKENNFIFQAPSVEKAEEFILKHFSGLSENSADGCDWIGNYISVLSTVDENSGYTPIFVVAD